MCFWLFSAFIDDVYARPTNTSDLHRLAGHPSAGCLRVRIAAIQEVLTEFSDTAIVRWLCLWLDQHAPLMLALERGGAADDVADDPNFDPMDQEPLIPSLPARCREMLPMLWAAKSATALKKWPLLRLLWKAAPRKCHSKDVEAMVCNISESSKSMASSIQAIHKASLLGNYPHARKRPPLPLRFSIYRKGVSDLSSEASSKHPFFLYSLKECLVSAVADDFGLRLELNRKTPWHEFESRVIECCDRMIRPYSSIAPIVSARMLLSQGKGAILPANAVPPQIKQIQAYSKAPPISLPISESPIIRAVTYEEWHRALAEGNSAVDDLLAKRVAPQVVPYHSWPLALHHRSAQEKAVHPPVPRAAVHTCPGCRSGYFVGHSVGGKKCEALGGVFYFLQNRINSTRFSFFSHRRRAHGKVALSGVPRQSRITVHLAHRPSCAVFHGLLHGVHEVSLSVEIF